MAKKYKKICEWCKRDFLTRDNRRVTCSSRCSREISNPTNPEVKARKRAYNQKPEVKARKRAYNQKPEVKARKRAYNQKYFSKPEVKAKQRAYNQKYFSKPEVKARNRFIQIKKTIYKKELKKNIQQKIFNRLLKEERNKKDG